MTYTLFGKIISEELGQKYTPDEWIVLRKQYLALESQMERTQFLLEKLGKNGIAVQEAFEAGVWKIQ